MMMEESRNDAIFCRLLLWEWMGEIVVVILSHITILKLASSRRG